MHSLWACALHKVDYNKRNSNFPICTSFNIYVTFWPPTVPHRCKLLFVSINDPFSLWCIVCITCYDTSALCFVTMWWKQCMSCLHHVFSPTRKMMMVMMIWIVTRYYYSDCFQSLGLGQSSVLLCTTTWKKRGRRTCGAWEMEFGGAYGAGKGELKKTHLITITEPSPKMLT